MSDNVEPKHRFLCRIDDCLQLFDDLQSIIQHKVACHPSQKTAVQTAVSQSATNRATQSANTNKLVIRKITQMPQPSASSEEPFQVVLNDTVYTEEGYIDQELSHAVTARTPSSSDVSSGTPRQPVSWDETATKHLLSIIEINKTLLDDKMTKNKRVWDVISETFNKSSGNQTTHKQCCDKYKNMLRTFKAWKTACMATGAATPKKLFYFDMLQDIVGSSHTITTPYLDDSEDNVRPKSAPPNFPVRGNLQPAPSSCRPSSSISNKRPMESSAIQQETPKRFMTDHGSAMDDVQPQAGPSGLCGTADHGEHPPNMEDFLDVELADEPADEAQERTKFRKKQLRPKGHNQVIQEYLIKQEDRMARQEERAEKLQEHQLRFFEDSSNSMTTFNTQMGQWLQILSKQKKKKSKKAPKTPSSSSEDSD